MLEITSRVRARAREANAKTALEMPTTQKKFFSLFSNFFFDFLILLKKVREMTHFPLWFRKWQGSQHRPFCRSKMGSLKELHLSSPSVCRA